MMVRLKGFDCGESRELIKQRVTVDRTDKALLHLCRNLSCKLAARWPRLHAPE